MQLLAARPAPTPRWFPWRRTYVPVDGCRLVESDAGGGAVSRAPLGHEPALPESLFAGTHEHVARLDAGGRSWALATPGPIDAVTARRIVDGVAEGFPYGEQPG